MIKKTTYFVFTFLCSLLVQAQQVDSLVNQLFYNINPNQTREVICKTMRRDVRFTQIIRSEEDTSEFPFMGYTYYGKVHSKGLVNVVPDSVDVQVSYGVSSGGFNSCKGNKTSDAYTFSFVQYEYYYQLADSLEKAYNYVLSLMQARYKNLADTRFVRTYPHGDVGTGKSYVFGTSANTKPSIELLKVTTKQGYSLRLEYSRLGD